jgi:phosphoglycerate dehydrogenase-like enzyme
MDRIILADKRKDAAGLKQYLASKQPELADLAIVDKSDCLASNGLYTSVRFVLGTWNMPVLTKEEVFRHLPNVKEVFYAGGDTKYFSPAFMEIGAKVTSAQLENSVPVAEFVLAQILLGNKGYFNAQVCYRNSFWRWGFGRARALSRMSPGNNGARVGLIGLGTVGSLVAEYLKPFELEIIAVDPFVDDNRLERMGVARSSLEELFATSDVISSHLPDTSQTEGILGYQHFNLMKPTAVFINTGRGRQIDEIGLIRALRECPSRTALLDVTRHEPPRPFSPLWRTKNVFLSPHIAGSQGNEVDRLYEVVLRRYLQALNEAGG